MVRLCICGSGKESEEVLDAQGIYLTRACPTCYAERVTRRFRPEILSGYTQADVGEPIEPEDSNLEAEYEDRNGDPLGFGSGEVE